MLSFNSFTLFIFFSPLFLSLFTFLFRSFHGEKILETSDDDDHSRPLEEEEADGGGGVPESLEEKETDEFVFNFRFQTFEEFSKSNQGNFGSHKLDSSGCSSSLSNRYEFSPEKSTSHFVEEAKVPSFTVEVLNSCSKHVGLGNGNFSVREVSGKVLESEVTDCFADGTEDFSGKILKFEAVGDGEITETNVKGEEQISEKQSEEEEDNEILRSSYSDTGVDVGGGFPSDLDLELETGGYEPEEEINEESEKSREEGNENREDSEEWEDEELKMEMKKGRGRGLATIYEESESPKVMGELRAWKIDERSEYGDLMEELHKFYKAYRERTRKLDILNFQKMYAMGVLQSKDPLESFCSDRKSSWPSSITSLLSHNLRLYRQKKCQVDPMKFIREVHCDLEMVYVGQMCLSWEFIQWQYEKALDLWESQPHTRLHHYNQVADDFQQFQVLLQRFLENEAFQGPRLQNYVKNRFVARNLLQVPVIREDKTRDKTRDKRKARKGKEDGYEAITSDILVEILQESIRVIWQFIRADKDHSNTTKRSKKFQVKLQNPADKQLLTEIQTDLQKKEKKVKEIMRSGNCILKKLQKKGGGGGDLCFLSKVDMKLVGRVLKMSRITTDQLIWCRNKLNRISFFNTQIHVHPSFFLFPCSC
ncbi:uncharacterized protein LOC111791379 isoform X2 [Cucurbita pepo subsp. pepo]|uniref:uncharacterized protein LOC111791379 isoform X2 n=1 Tax=Cucurbita pepo subsp. pepo TaxID=3664 RepID=UPI000C9D269C|nr:uncharacterized protein LOC111791379 isoform X2 [Cucurbita pepo subsp. pepo]